MLFRVWHKKLISQGAGFDVYEKATPKAETLHEKLQRYQEKADKQNTNQPYQSKDKGAR